MTFIANRFIQVSVSAIVLLLSYVLKSEAFSRTSSPNISALTSGSALYSQVLDADDGGCSNNEGDGDQPWRPFFFTGEPKSDAENRELQRVFLGAESLRSSRAEGTTEQTPASGNAISFDQERENLERLFRL